MTAPVAKAKPNSFQDLILRLQNYWAEQGCAILQPYDMEVGAGTLHPATVLRALGPNWVVLKGGHLGGSDSPDLLAGPDDPVWLEAPRTDTPNTHGTGCTLSAALAAELGKGQDTRPAFNAAKTYLSGAVANAGRLSVGRGHGPTHHFHALWRDVD